MLNFASKIEVTEKLRQGVLVLHYHFEEQETFFIMTNLVIHHSILCYQQRFSFIPGIP